MYMGATAVRVSELIIGHTGGVERIATIIIKIRARLGPPGDRMKRFEVIWGRSITQNVGFKCGPVIFFGPAGDGTRAGGRVRCARAERE